MVFKVTDKDVFKDNPVLHAFEEFSKCTSKQLKYVFLAFDYDGPFRKMPLEEKKYQAALRAGYKMEPSGDRLDKNARSVISGKVKSVETAVKCFMDMQFDEERDVYEGLCEEIRDIAQFWRKKDKTVAERKMSILYIKEIVDMQKKKKELAEILEIRKDIVKEEEDKDVTLSTLDKFNMEGQNG